MVRHTVHYSHNWRNFCLFIISVVQITWMCDNIRISQLSTCTDTFNLISRVRALAQSSVANSLSRAISELSLIKLHFFSHKSPIHSNAVAKFRVCLPTPDSVSAVSHETARRDRMLWIWLMLSLLFESEHPGLDFVSRNLLILLLNSVLIFTTRTFHFSYLITRNQDVSTVPTLVSVD